MRRTRYIAIVALLAGSLWLARPKGLCDIYRGYLEGRASGAMVFSIVQAVGESASRGFPAAN